MSHRFRTTDWQCPRCRRKDQTRHLFEDGYWAGVITEPHYCTGLMAGAHPPVEMTMTGYTERPATGNGPVQYHTEETKMPEYAQGGFIQQPRFPREHPWASILEDFNRQIDDMAQQLRAQREAARPENLFRALKVIEGDRLRLTAKTSPDASQLEGKVIGIKVKDGKSQVRIAGFDHTGGNAGGQHVWFPVENYTVEVLHRAFRWTPDDEIIVELMGLDRKVWEKYDEATRESHRKYKAERVARIKKALAGEF